jgi:membrane fusion protein (multidrug efflux system)
MFKRLAAIAIIVLIFVGAIFGYQYYQHLKKQGGQQHGMPPATIASAEVKQMQWRPALRSVGSLVATNGISVSTEVDGIVSDILFRSGKTVKEGEVLIKLDDRVDQAALEALRADRRLAEVQFNRSKDLYKKRVTSKSQYDEAKAKLEATTARVAEQEAVIDRKTIRAPFDGLLGIRQVDLGQYLNAGGSIVSLQAIDPIHVDYTLPERYLKQIAVGQDVEVRLDALPGKVYQGKITALDSGISRGTRTLKIRATLDNEDGEMRPGMFAEVRTLNPEAKQVLVVPRTAISYQTYGDFVYVIEQKGEGPPTVARRPVTTGEVRNGLVAIESGLEAGEKVVRAGLVKLRPGMPVKIDNSVELDDNKVSGE